MSFTVLGASGFIGRHLVTSLRQAGHEVFTPARDDQALFRRPLGHVIYCIGVTADFRHRPFDTVRAHVAILADVLERCDFHSLLYLSSTRIYMKVANTNEEASLSVVPRDPSDLYNLSKLTGESLTLNCGRPCTRVARISNVVGYDPNSENFISSLIREALTGVIRLRSSPDSSKDYILLDDVISILPRISLSGRERIYNVASGGNTPHRELIEALTLLTGCNAEYEQSSPLTVFPSLQTSRLRREFSITPANPMEHLPRLLEQYREGAKA